MKRVIPECFGRGSIPVRRVIVALHEYLARKTHEQKEAERMLARSPKLRTRFNHRQVAFLPHALKQTGEAFRMDTHQRFHGAVYQTARSDLQDLESIGLLERQQQGDAPLFFAPDNLRDRPAKLSAQKKASTV